MFQPTTHSLAELLNVLSSIYNIIATHPSDLLPNMVKKGAITSPDNPQVTKAVALSKSSPSLTVTQVMLASEFTSKDTNTKRENVDHASNAEQQEGSKVNIGHQSSISSTKKYHQAEHKSAASCSKKREKEEVNLKCPRRVCF